MTKKEQILLSSVVQQGKEQVSTELDGEVVLMSIEQGNYYGMDEVGSRIWTLIEKPHSVSSIVEILLEEFSIERSQCETDVLSFLNQIAEENLIILSDEKAA